MTAEASNGHEDRFTEESDKERMTMSTTSNGYIHKTDEPSAKMESNGFVDGHTREEIIERTTDESDEVGVA